MSSSIGSTGLTVATSSEIIAALKTGMQGIYGASINVDQNSPDGQMIGLFAQQVIDYLEFLVSVNNQFDPDQAQGDILDQRVALNNIQRLGGTYTVQPISIIVNATVTLQGLDGNYNSPTGTGYTVQDSSGNLFILATTATLTAGTHVADFRASNIGAVSVPINTITTPVTIVQGVVSVNNPNSAISVGQTQETDTQLRTRRQQSVALSTTGYLNGLLGAIQGLTGVTEAVLYENDTGSTDANGITAHTIWLIVAGGSSVDIATQIYNRKSYGCNMRGAVTYNITTASGAIFVAKWDTPVAETLYVKFTIQSTVSGYSFSAGSISAYIAANKVYGIGEAAETSSLTALAIAAIAAQGGGGVPLLMQVSDDGISWTDYLAPTGIGYQFTLSASNIAITII